MKLKKFKYWVSICLDDCRVYNIRAKTKKEVLGKSEGRLGYSPPVKHEIEYYDIMDLVCAVSGENGNSEPTADKYGNEYGEGYTLEVEDHIKGRTVYYRWKNDKWIKTTNPHKRKETR